MPELQNRRHELFCRAYLLEPNGTKAALEAGYARKSAGGMARDILVREDVKVRLAELRKPEDEEFKAKAAETLQRIWDMATADARDLSQYRIGSCRYCHAIDHAYQWKTHRQYAEALHKRVQALRRDQVEPLFPESDPTWPWDTGGLGYRLNRHPDSNCPECGGWACPLSPPPTPPSYRPKLPCC